MKMRLFTVKTISESGLGDQLVTQFSRLYMLGIMADCTYVYTPLDFHRSIKSEKYLLYHSWIYQIRKIIFKYLGQSKVSNILNILLLKIEGYVERNLKNVNDDELCDFLNLSDIGKNDYHVKKDIKLINLPIIEILKNKFDCMTDFSSFINNCYSKNEEVMLCFSWSENGWAAIPEIDKLISLSGLNREKLTSELFRNAFWRNQSVMHSDKLNIVFHIRSGDSTSVKLSNREIIVFDKKIFSSEDEMKDIFLIDSSRHAVLAEEYLIVYEQCLKKFGFENVSTTLISDGYELTYQVILRNLLKRRCSIKLTKNERIQLLMKMNSMNDVFSHFKSASLCIGESKQNLFDSIYAIANSDLLFWGCGGFAVHTHLLFNNKNGKILNIKNYSSDQL